MIEMEYLASRNGDDIGSIWYGLGCYYRPVFSLVRRVHLVRSARLNGRPSPSEMDDLVLELLERLPDGIPFLPAVNTFDNDATVVVLEGLCDENRRYIGNRMKEISLPVTGAHGDFTDENAVCDDDGKIYLIDWDRYRENGSVITDILRLYSLRGERMMRKKGIDASIFDPGTPLPFPKEVWERLDAMGYERNDLGVLAALTHLYFPRFSKVRLQRRIAKFDRFLTKIID